MELHETRHHDTGTAAPDSAFHQIARNAEVAHHVEALVQPVQPLAADHRMAEARLVDVAIRKATDLATGAQGREGFAAGGANIVIDRVVEHLLAAQAIAQIKQAKFIIEIDFVQQAALQQIKIHLGYLKLRNACHGDIV